MDHNVGPGSMNELRVPWEDLLGWIYSLDIIQDGLDILRLLQVRPENCWRGRTRISLSDDENPRVLEGIEDLASEEAASSGHKYYGSHVRAIVKGKMSAGENSNPFVAFRGVAMT